MRTESAEREVRGLVSATGTVLRGAGFFVVKNSTGNYTVWFAQGFRSAPVVVGSPAITSNCASNITATTPNSFTVALYATSTATPTDTAFTFSAKGAR